MIPFRLFTKQELMEQFVIDMSTNKFSHMTKTKLMAKNSEIMRKSKLKMFTKSPKSRHNNRMHSITPKRKSRNKKKRSVVKKKSFEKRRNRDGSQYIYSVKSLKNTTQNSFMFNNSKGFEREGSSSPIEGKQHRKQGKQTTILEEMESFVNISGMDLHSATNEIIRWWNNLHIEQ